MAQLDALTPFGAGPVEGIVHYLSERNVQDTVAALSLTIEGAGAKIFADIDQAAEAKQAGLELRPTRLIVFGNPRAGTALMQAVPLAALDLPLKLLVWQADDGRTWVTCLSGEWLRARYGIPENFAGVLGTAEHLASRAIS